MSGGNFEKAIPKTLKELLALLGAKQREIGYIYAEYQHNCNCEYCDVTEEEEIPHEAQMKIKSLEDDVAEIKWTTNRLKDHAKLHGMKLKDKS